MNNCQVLKVGKYFFTQRVTVRGQTECSTICQMLRLIKPFACWAHLRKQPDRSNKINVITNL